ncbi:MAG: ABC transporter ATP-binding protein [Rhodospirillales bacterium]|nr:ABC transporter ATP-binding protein [Acetobacter sp.]
MQSDPIITVENLSKRYQLGLSQRQERYTALRDVIARKAQNLFRARQPTTEAGVQAGEFWALHDVSFSVGRGEVIGIVGRNGAGKSTLLKILSRITEPTSGRIRLKGRVASLLEVGTGFHPELTGRENIFLNGAILGMHRTEIKAKFDEIVAFAEVEKFLDTPVKRYSSGMYVRLAFAVAAHLEPEILVVDEVLAVGDANFQKKCLGKMQDVARGEGRTVLLVSHNMGQLLSICRRILWLKQGCLEQSGEVHSVINKYLAEGSVDSGEYLFPKAAETTPIQFERATVYDVDGNVSSTLDVKAPFTIELVYLANTLLTGVDISLKISNANGVSVFSSNRSRYLSEEIARGVHRSSIKIPEEFLMPDKYMVSVSAFQLNGALFHVHENFLSFSVQETGSHMARYSSNPANVGVVLVHFPWNEAAGMAR